MKAKKLCFNFVGSDLVGAGGQKTISSVNEKACPTYNNIITSHESRYNFYYSDNKPHILHTLDKNKIDIALDPKTDPSTQLLSKIKKNDRILFTKSCNLSKEKINKFITDNNIAKANKRSNIDYVIANKNMVEGSFLNDKDYTMLINFNIAKELANYLGNVPLPNSDDRPKESRFCIDNVIDYYQKTVLPKANMKGSKEDLVEFIFFNTMFSIYVPQRSQSTHWTYFYPKEGFVFERMWFTQKQKDIMFSQLKGINSIIDVYQKTYNFIINEFKGDISVRVPNNNNTYLSTLETNIKNLGFDYDISVEYPICVDHGNSRLFENFDEISYALNNDILIWEDSLNDNVNESLGFEFDFDYYVNLKQFFDSRVDNNVKLAKETLCNFKFDDVFIYLCFLNNEYGDRFTKSSSLKPFKMLLGKFFETIKNKKIYCYWGDNKLLPMVKTLLASHPNDKELIMKLLINRMNSQLGDEYIKDIVLK